MKLYELTAAYNNVLDMAEDLDQETLLDTLESIQEGIEDKAENTAKLIRSIEADVEAIKTEEKRMADRRKALESKASSIKAYLQQQLETAGIDKIKRPTLTVSLQNNPASVSVLDESLIPLEYLVPQPSKVSKKDILADLKKGQAVPGVELVQTKGLRIR
ncbi:MAG: siphovirus Gp157 family protein [Bacillus sp. (in: firmicutes)]